MKFCDFQTSWEKDSDVLFYEFYDPKILWTLIELSTDVKVTGSYVKAQTVNLIVYASFHSHFYRDMKPTLFSVPVFFSFTLSHGHGATQAWVTQRSPCNAKRSLHCAANSERALFYAMLLENLRWNEANMNSYRWWRSNIQRCTGLYGHVSAI